MRPCPKDFDDLLGFSLPLGHYYSGPYGRRGAQYFVQGWQPLPFQSWSSRPARRAGGGIKCGIQPQAGNHAYWLSRLRQFVQQCQYGKATIGDDDHLALWQPATHLQRHLACPISQLLEALAALAMIAF
jgi:hypothetical protein